MNTQKIQKLFAEKIADSEKAIDKLDQILKILIDNQGKKLTKRHLGVTPIVSYGSRYRIYSNELRRGLTFDNPPTPKDIKSITAWRDSLREDLGSLKEQSRNWKSFVVEREQVKNLVKKTFEQVYAFKNKYSDIINDTRLLQEITGNKYPQERTPHPIEF